MPVLCYHTSTHALSGFANDRHFTALSGEQADMHPLIHSLKDIYWLNRKQVVWKNGTPHALWVGR